MKKKLIETLPNATNVLFGDERYFRLIGYVNIDNFRYWNERKFTGNTLEACEK